MHKCEWLKSIREAKTIINNVFSKLTMDYGKLSRHRLSFMMVQPTYWRQNVTKCLVLRRKNLYPYLLSFFIVTKVTGLFFFLGFVYNNFWHQVNLICFSSELYYWLTYKPGRIPLLLQKTFYFLAFYKKTCFEQFCLALNNSPTAMALITGGGWLLFACKIVSPVVGLW